MLKRELRGELADPSLDDVYLVGSRLGLLAALALVCAALATRAFGSYQRSL
jgi:hypothetical protein